MKLCKENRNHKTPTRIILDNVEYAQRKGCWKWTGAKNNKGYGSAGYNGRIEGAHRISYMVFIGEIPEGKNVCHTCDDPACVFPGHLFLGTQSENLQDMRDKGRGRVQDGEKNNMATLTEIDVRNMRADHKCGATAKELAEVYRTSKQNIYRIINRERWTHI